MHFQQNPSKRFCGSQSHVTSNIKILSITNEVVSLICFSNVVKHFTALKPRIVAEKYHIQEILCHQIKQISTNCYIILVQKFLTGKAAIVITRPGH